MRVSHRGGPAVASDSRTVAVICPLCMSRPAARGWTTHNSSFIIGLPPVFGGGVDGGGAGRSDSDSRPAWARLRFAARPRPEGRVQFGARCRTGRVSLGSGITPTIETRRPRVPPPPLLCDRRRSVLTNFILRGERRVVAHDRLVQKPIPAPIPTRKQDEPLVHAHEEPAADRPVQRRPGLMTDAAAHAGAERQRRAGVVPLQEPPRRQHVDCNVTPSRVLRR